MLLTSLKVLLIIERDWLTILSCCISLFWGLLSRLGQSLHWKCVSQCNVCPISRLQSSFCHISRREVIPLSPHQPYLCPSPIHPPPLTEGRRIKVSREKKQAESRRQVCQTYNWVFIVAREREKSRWVSWQVETFLRQSVPWRVISLT